MSVFSQFAFWAVDSGYVPDLAIRAGIRALCRQRLKDISVSDEHLPQRLQGFIQDLDRAPVAPLVEKANEQHYEVPARFFECVLGAHLKYSSAHWDGVDALDDAEAQALTL